MSDEEEHESRCGESFPMELLTLSIPLRPRRDAPPPLAACLAWAGSGSKPRRASCVRAPSTP